MHPPEATNSPVFVLTWVAALLCLLAGVSISAEPDVLPRGIWPLPRHDAHNTGRADVAGDYTQAPREIWSFGAAGHAFDFLRPLGASGVSFALSRSAVKAVRSDGSVVWDLPNFGATRVIEVCDFGERGSAALVVTGNSGLAFIDAATGRVPWRWRLPPGVASLGGPKVWRQGNAWRLVLFPQGTTGGECWEFAAPDEAARLVWKQDYPNRYWANFGPYPVIADMNNDGRDDIVLFGKPAYVGVIDADTGAMSFDLQYPIAGEAGIGRPYGLLQAVDLDNDGFRDVVVASCQVEEYIAVLRNEGGTALKLAWSRFVEHDFPDDTRELRPQVTSIADVDGDGRKEIVLGLFNEQADGRWRTVVLDALGGWAARKRELSDRYFWGCYDLGGDGRAELITSTETARRCKPQTILQAVDGKTGRDIAVLENAALSTAAAPLRADIAFHANRATPIYVEGLGSGPGGVVVRLEVPSDEVLWSLADQASRFSPFAITADARVAFLNQSGLRIREPQFAIGDFKKTAAASSVSGPLIAISGGKRELIAARADGVIIGGVVDWRRPGGFVSSWSARGVHPAVWTGLDGTRLVAAFDATADALHVYCPVPGQQNAPPVFSASLPHEPFRSPGFILPFGLKEPRFYVGMKTGVHTCAGAVFDGSGRQQWLDDKNGPYPRAAGLLDAQQGTLVVDDHGKHFIYDRDGAKRLIAHGWGATIPGRADGAKYALPIIGPFGSAGELRVVMSPGLDALEVLDHAGTRLIRSPYGSTYEREWCGSAVSRIRAGNDAGWDLGMLAKDGMFHCADLATGKTRWSFDTQVEAVHPARIASGDIDGDGRDNFLAGLANGELLALDEQDGHAVVLWRVALDVAIRDVLLADVDGDGKAEVVVETDDGRIRILGKKKQPADEPK